MWHRDLFTIGLLFLILVCCRAKLLHPYGKHNVSIIGLFHPEEIEEKLAFRIAIDHVNLIVFKEEEIQITPRVEEVSPYDSFNISKRICNILAEENSNVVAIFGPQADTSIGIVKAISNRYEIPHIETRWETTSWTSKMTINLYPESERLAEALTAAIEDMDWRSFTIIYEDDIGLLRLQRVLKAHDGYAKEEGQTPFTLHQLGEGDHRPLLKEIKASGEIHIVLDCKAEHIVNILREAKEVGMMGDYHSYIVTSLDAHTIDFEEFKFGRTNITALRMLNPQSYVLQKAIQDWIFEENRHNHTSIISSTTVKTQSALMYDAVHLFASTWQTLISSYESPGPIHCFSNQPLDRKAVESSQGYKLISYMKKMEKEGMSGKMTFNDKGHRVGFTLEIIQLLNEGFRKLAFWNPVTGITYTRSKSEIEGEQLQNIKNKTFIVVSRKGRPYLDLRRTEDESIILKGNDRFEGYSVDLISEIAKELGFMFEFVLVPDGQYGSLNKKTGQWNGLIRELQERRADLAICDLTITYDRRSAVDFTMPFMTLGISILFSKPVKQPPDLFSFFKPLSLDVWVYMATAYLGVSLMLYFLSRCSPFEWENPHPCNPDPEELELTFTLPNCLWFAIGSLMQQGCDLLPKAVSTRLVAGMWWFFTLIMISSYTANLAAFLTMERMDAPIKSVEDLAQQNKIKYGVMAGGSTANFFRDSNVSMYQRMWSAMESAQPSVFVKNNDEGVERVQKGKRQYAYFMESTSIEYQMERKCDLAMIGGKLDSKGYGIAMPSDSPYRTQISGAVLKMQESGKLEELKTKWWKRMHGGGACDNQDEASTSNNELGLANVGGVFLVLIVGCAISFLVAVLEFLWNVRKVAIQEKISPTEAFLLELKFALLCHGTSKPVRKAKEPSSAKGSFMRLDVFENNNH